MRDLSTEGNLRFKIDCASRIVGSQFTVFALFYFLFEGNFPSTSLRGAYIWRGDLTEGFLRYRIGGLIFGGAYIWRGLFSEFYGMCKALPFLCCPIKNFIQHEKGKRMCFDFKFCFSFGESRLRDSITASNKLDDYRQDRIAGGPQGQHSLLTKN